MKVLYHIGETIGAETIVKKGILKDDARPIVIESDTERIVLDDMKSVGFFRPSILGTTVKVRNGSITILLFVPRLYLDIGTGFAIVNVLKTRKLKSILEAELSS